MMSPICFYIGNRPIYWYGVMVALAFLVALIHLTLLGRKAGRAYSYVSDYCFWVMIAGILGARIAYVLANMRDFMAAPLTIIRIDQGGLIYYGGFIGAGLATIVFARVRRESLLALADFVITALPLGQAIGRIGCFLNGCCFGTACSLPWGVVVDGTVRHPTPLYEAGWNLAVYGILLWLYGRRPPAGRVLAAYLMLYPAGRFALEFFRGDERIHWLGLSVAQGISLGLFLIGILLWVFANVRRSCPRPSPSHG